jgi:hypothetical protein
MINQNTCRTACLITLLVTMAVGVMILGGCGSTQLVDLWSDPSYKAVPLNKLLVVAMRKDQLRRRMWEDAFVTALGKQQAGTAVDASYHLFPNEVPDTTALEKISKEQGFDGVLIVAKVERGTVTREVPAYLSTEPVTKYRRRWNTYVTRYETIYHPGYTDTASVFSVRTDLLLAQEAGRLVWSATSREVDPASPDQFRKGVADKVAEQLKKSGLAP